MLLMMLLFVATFCVRVLGGTSDIFAPFPDASEEEVNLYLSTDDLCGNASVGRALHRGSLLEDNSLCSRQLPNDLD